MTSAPAFNSAEIKRLISEDVVFVLLVLKEMVISADAGLLLGAEVLVLDGVADGEAGIFLVGLVDGDGAASRVRDGVGVVLETQTLLTHLSPLTHVFGQAPPHPSLPHSFPVQSGQQSASFVARAKVIFPKSCAS